jgi:hypothetical protein
VQACSGCPDPFEGFLPLSKRLALPSSPLPCRAGRVYTAARALKVQRLKGTRVRNGKLALALLVCVCALGGQPIPFVHGTWTATVGPREVLHGAWTGRTLPGRPNVGEGSWTLVNAGQVVLAGTWRAEKTHRRWEGSWTGRTMDGRSLAGTWGAYLQEWNGKTFQDLLERTLQQEVSGWWQSGRDQGHWWLKGSASQESAPPHPLEKPTPQKSR